MRRRRRTLPGSIRWLGLPQAHERAGRCSARSRTRHRGSPWSPGSGGRRTAERRDRTQARRLPLAYPRARARHQPPLPVREPHLRHGGTGRRANAPAASASVRTSLRIPVAPVQQSAVLPRSRSRLWSAGRPGSPSRRRATVSESFARSRYRRRRRRAAKQQMRPGAEQGSFHSVRSALMAMLALCDATFFGHSTHLRHIFQLSQVPSQQT
jgi:hypothetical protein